jgi:phage gp36-like protein
MASYATRAELEKYGVDAEIISDVSNDDVDDILEAVSRVADSYLSHRYALPLVSFGADLTINVCEIASFRLLVSKKLLAPMTNDYEVWRDRADAATRWFEGITKGHICPTGIVSATPASDGLSIVVSDTQVIW